MRKMTETFKPMVYIMETFTFSNNVDQISQNI